MFSECSPSSNLYSVFAESFLLTQVPFRALLRNWESLLWLIIRMHFHMWWYSLNPYKIPVINDMFMKATRLFDSDYYGYINSDILVTPNLFQFIELCRLNAEEGNINKRVSVIEWMNGSMKSQEEFTTSNVTISWNREHFLLIWQNSRSWQNNRSNCVTPIRLWVRRDEFTCRTTLSSPDTSTFQNFFLLWSEERKWITIWCGFLTNLQWPKKIFVTVVINGPRKVI